MHVIIFRGQDNPPEEKIRFWLAECRSPELLLQLVKRYPEIASRISTDRVVLHSAMQGKLDDVKKLLREEEDKEREADRQYWLPLKKELEKLRFKRDH
jgi:hypothetical protein